MELLLHPRLPPLLRSLPHLESLSLFKAEESHEEANVISSLTLKSVQSQECETVEEDVVMENSISNNEPKDTAVQKLQLPEDQQQHKPSEVSSQHKPSDAISRSNFETSVSEIIKLNSTTLFSAIGTGEIVPSSSANDVFLPPIPVASTSNDEDEVGDIPHINMSSDSESDEE